MLLKRYAKVNAVKKPYSLTKSSMLSYRQCAKKLWLEKNKPELAKVDPATERVFQTGHAVGEVAHQIYGAGHLVGFEKGAKEAIRDTQAVLDSRQKNPIYEATFLYEDVLVRADVVKPTSTGLRIIEVKSSTDVKDVNIEDCAIQAWVIEGSGQKVQSVHLAHINRDFVYPGDERYDGLLVEKPLNADIKPFKPAVGDWVKGAKGTLAGSEPKKEIGSHCYSPYECPFLNYCSPLGSDYPLSTLPRLGKKQLEVLEASGYLDIRDIPSGVLTNENHERVRRVTISGNHELDPAAGRILSELEYPRYYLDFETIAFAVPIWAGTRPYQQLPFQWSCHIEAGDGSISHAWFLDISGLPPMRECIEKLIATVGQRGPIFAYSGFERTTLTKMAELMPEYRAAIDAIIERLFDLLPLVRDHYYHPAMKGSWSIKYVLPTVAPDLDYSLLEGVRDGGAAQAAYLEAIAAATDPDRKQLLNGQMLAYCERDTEAMLRVVHFFCS